MPEEKKTLFSDEFLNELAKEINDQYGWTVNEENENQSFFKG